MYTHLKNPYTSPQNSSHHKATFFYNFNSNKKEKPTYSTEETPYKYLKNQRKNVTAAYNLGLLSFLRKDVKYTFTTTAPLLPSFLQLLYIVI